MCPFSLFPLSGDFDQRPEWCRGYWSSQGRVEKAWNWVAECNNLGGAYIRKNVFFLRWRGERYLMQRIMGSWPMGWLMESKKGEQYNVSLLPLGLSKPKIFCLFRRFRPNWGRFWGEFFPLGGLWSMSGSSGPDSLNRISASISGTSARIRL